MANRVMVVEDEPAISDGISLNLELAGYECRVFGDGLEAAESLKTDHSYDIALLDIMLPGMDGYQLIPIVREYGIPAICLTAKNDSASEIHGLKTGAEDYITKPFEMVTLLARIEKVLEREGKLNAVIRYRDLTVNTADRTVEKDGVLVALTPIEFDLLEMLARHIGRTIPREELLSKVWGTDFYGDSRTIDVHIAHIRKKLGLGEKIRTVPKIGYRLEE